MLSLRSIKIYSWKLDLLKNKVREFNFLILLTYYYTYSNANNGDYLNFHLGLPVDHFLFLCYIRHSQERQMSMSKVLVEK